jgi:hypothetical protein
MWKETKDFMNAAMRSTRQSSEHQLSFSKVGETTEVAEKKEEMSMNFRLFCLHLSFFLLLLLSSVFPFVLK